MTQKERVLVGLTLLLIVFLLLAAAGALWFYFIHVRWSPLWLFGSGVVGAYLTLKLGDWLAE